VEQQQIERIRNPNFTLSRRGYDQREVDHFMVDLAEWLENGGIEEVGSYAVTKRLERAGETTARVLAAAQAEADQILKEAEDEARRMVGDAQEASRKKLEHTREQTRAMVEEAERKAAAIRDTIAQLSEVQRRVLTEIGSLRDVLGTAIAAAPAPPAAPAELPPVTASATAGG
jgi:DivIVA domain-containing protein